MNLIMRKEYDIYLQWDKPDNCRVFDQVKQEFLFRLNPHWRINTFSCSAGSFQADIEDHETGQPSTLSGQYSRTPEGFPVISAEGTIWKTFFFFEKNGTLHVGIEYNQTPSEDEERQLVLWLRSIKEYLRLYKTNSLNTRFFKFLMNRVILQMNPSQRKISLMLIRITILELLVILSILVGWFFFFR